ncbi:hypothetical protein OsJ_09820 [Oryza sativa Japonica Group]|uniref:Uncharacterized protein n=1 Tax=Oryza sativa subsp. japonica TaxID=39947 RepID=B9F613_ORYSJ|nr:hypothetical protein OsJ_09820 [Oryza sativa Japonica Group]
MESAAAKKPLKRYQKQAQQEFSELKNWVIAKFVWCSVIEVIEGVLIPTNFWDSLKAVKEKLGVNLGLFLCASLCWGLRLVVFKSISLMQRWKVLLREKDHEALNALLEKLKSKMEALRPVDVLPDNVIA